MMTFAQVWQRHEQTRHYSLLQQLKSEMASHRTTTAPAAPQPRSAAPVVPSTPATPATSPSVATAPRPKVNKPHVRTRHLVEAVAIH